MSLLTQFGSHTLLRVLTGVLVARPFWPENTECRAGRRDVVKRPRAAVVKNDLAREALCNQAEEGIELHHPAIAPTYSFPTIQSWVRMSPVIHLWGTLRHIAERGMALGRFISLDLAVHAVISLTKGPHTPTRSVLAGLTEISLPKILCWDSMARFTFSIQLTPGNLRPRGTKASHCAQTELYQSRGGTGCVDRQTV